MLPLLGKSQKQDRIWLFPDSAGIDFNNLSNPITRSSNITDPCGNNFANICDQSGNLLFYSSGIDLSFISIRVYDKYENLMDGGDSLIGHPWVYDGSMILPMPGDTNKYYLFVGNRTGSMGNHMYYNIVDMSQNSGLGKVISKNNLLLSDYVNEKMAAVKHANGRDWWLILMSTNTDSLFHKFLITPDSLIGPIDQIIGSADNPKKFFGHMLFSEDGTKMVAASSNSMLDLYDFDRCSGDLFNYRNIGEPVYSVANRYNGCSFSPNGNVVYVASIDYQAKNFYQFDLTASSIHSTKQLLISYPDTGNMHLIGFYGQKLGPDGQIYIIKANGFGTNSDTYNTHHLDVIQFPDNVGPSCNYLTNSFDLGNGKAASGMPNMPNYNLGPLHGSICDSLSSGIHEQLSENAIRIFPNPFIDAVSIRSVLPIHANVIIRDEIGNEVKNFSFAENETIDLSSLSAGVYYLEIRNDDLVFEKRLVKLK
ncbi:MAG: T9SS type A sorting domain-containing protein [Bacteroidetes bacterium]|nr:T9SS type A sorting domain-containing protein [Bacteroidota bacterium]